MFSLIQSSSRIGIFTHINPDGDALGSSFGLASYLQERGKSVTVFLPTSISESLSFMVPQPVKEGRSFGISVWDPDREDAIKQTIADCDLLIGVDFNVTSRIGDLGPLLEGAKAAKILIDHHVGPQEDAFDIVRSQTDISSASELVYQILTEQEANLAGAGTTSGSANSGAGTATGDSPTSKLSQITREALLTGMTTDTNNFANSVFPSTLSMASELIAAGTDRDKIIDNLYFRYPERCIRLRGHALETLMKINPRGIGYIILDAQTLERFGIQEGDTEGLVNIPLSIDRVRMSILAKEEPATRKIRISIRSKKGTSARDCAMRFFHGGGHEQASGGRLMKGEDVESIIEVESYIEKMSEEFIME